MSAVGGEKSGQAQQGQSQPQARSAASAGAQEARQEQSSERRGDGGSATQRELQRLRDQREAQEKADMEAIEAQHAATEAFRNEYEGDDRGNVMRQVQEAERIMRSPGISDATVDQHGNRVEPGHVPGDPTKGPSH